ncbi:hypothetical protein HUJ05_009033, partial [Dendroctonus ponderosae]
MCWCSAKVQVRLLWYNVPKKIPSFSAHNQQAQFRHEDFISAEFVIREVLRKNTTKSSAKNYQCPQCLKAYKHKHVLKRHNSTGRHQCPNCARSYTLKRNLNSHLKEECGVPPKFFCFVCCRGFKKKHHLNRHVT